jgi:hypothetical protein
MSQGRQDLSKARMQNRYSIAVLSNLEVTNCILFFKVYLGWGQKRISDYGWFEAVQRGFATLYLKRSSMRGSIYNTNAVEFLDYYIIRDGDTVVKEYNKWAEANKK